MAENRVPLHFIYLIVLAIMWGSAFLFIKISLETIPPLTVAAGRITIGAIITTLIALKMGSRFPRDLSQWLQCGAIGVAGNVVPFFLAAWCVQYVQSSLAAICMSLIPLFTLILAHFMTQDEKFSTHKLIGILFGIIGVSSLFVGTLTDINNSSLLYLALFGLLVTSFAYALSGVMIKGLKNKDPLSTSAMMLITSTVIIIPLTLYFEQPWTLTPSTASLYSVAVLGIFPTGLAALLLFHLTHKTSATFVSYNTYLIPLVGMAAGYIWLFEPLKMIYLVSTLFIFVGIYLAEKSKPKPELN